MWDAPKKRLFSFRFRMQRNARRLGEMIRRKPYSPLDLALDWVEFLAEFKTLDNLLPESRNMGLFRYYLLDVLSVACLVSVACFWTVVYCLCWCYRKVFKSKVKTEWHSLNWKCVWNFKCSLAWKCPDVQRLEFTVYSKFETLVSNLNHPPCNLWCHCSHHTTAHHSTAQHTTAQHSTPQHTMVHVDVNCSCRFHAVHPLFAWLFTQHDPRFYWPCYLSACAH